MPVLHLVTKLFAFIGAINWGLISLFSFNLVECLFGKSSITQIIYTTVGASGLFQFVNMAKNVIMSESNRS